jgi:hypothetical protein
VEARHGAHAWVEDRIRTGKDTGLGRLPSRHQKIDAVWVELALIATDLPALTQSMLLTDDEDLHRAEPEDAALPAAAHRRSDHPGPAQGVPAAGRALAVDPRPDLT